MQHAPLTDALLDHPVPKHYRSGTHRLVAPGETTRRMRPLLPAMGITRIADVTGLDRIGIPVVMVCRPNSRSLAVSQGKGLDLDAAKASGLMEAIELYHAEHIDLPLRLASYEELRYKYRVVDVSTLPRQIDGQFHPHIPIHWIEGYDLIQREPVWVPYDLVHTNYTVGMRHSAACFLGSSNGLASGNHLLEAISHGICEVVERDATSLWHLLDAEAQAATRIDLADIGDPGCRALLIAYRRAEVDVGVWDITSDIGIPAFLCQITDRHDSSLRRLGSMACMGCHPQREIALIRALTEAAQSRLTMIAGARDDCFHENYRTATHASSCVHQRELLEQPALRGLTTVPDYQSDTFNQDISWALERLRGCGLKRAIAVDLTRSEFRIPVVRVIIPGLEPFSDRHDYVPGARSQRVQRQATSSREGLV